MERYGNWGDRRGWDKDGRWIISRRRVGSLVGRRVGSLVGRRVDYLVGRRVDSLVGRRVDSLVMQRVGSLVGWRVDYLVGRRVDSLVGRRVGSLVGRRRVGSRSMYSVEIIHRHSGNANGNDYFEVIFIEEDCLLPTLKDCLPLNMLIVIK